MGEVKERYVLEDLEIFRKYESQIWASLFQL